MERDMKKLLFGLGLCVCVAGYGFVSWTGCTPQSESEGTAPDGGATQDAQASLKWFTTCGDPACGSHRPNPNVSQCTNEKDGDACSSEGTQCDPVNNCNAYLVCASADPKVNCPQSSRARKEQIKYLHDKDRRALHQALMKLRLASYRYKKTKGPRQLGFIIEDRPAPSLLFSHRKRVDLYSYLSMVTAALQHQNQEIRALKEQLKQERAACPKPPQSQSSSAQSLVCKE